MLNWNLNLSLLKYFATKRQQNFLMIDNWPSLTVITYHFPIQSTHQSGLHSQETHFGRGAPFISSFEDSEFKQFFINLTFAMVVMHPKHISLSWCNIKWKVQSILYFKAKKTIFLRNFFFVCFQKIKSVFKCVYTKLSTSSWTS